MSVDGTSQKMGLRYSEERNFRCTSLAHGSCNLLQKNGKFRCKLYELWPKNRPKTDSRPRHLAALQFNRMHWLSKSYQRFNKLMRNFCESFRSNASFLPEIQPLFEYADVSKLMGPQEGAVNGSYTHKNTHKHTHTHTRRLTFTHPDTASHTQTQRQTYFFLLTSAGSKIGCISGNFCAISMKISQKLRMSLLNL